MLKYLVQSLFALAMLALSPLAATAETSASYEEAYNFGDAQRRVNPPSDSPSPYKVWAQIDFKSGGPYLGEACRLLHGERGITAEEFTISECYNEIALQNGHSDPDVIPAGKLWVPSPQNSPDSIRAGLAEYRVLQAIAGNPLLAAERIRDAERAIEFKASEPAVDKVAAATAKNAEALAAFKKELGERVDVLAGKIAALEASDQEQDSLLGRLQGAYDALVGTNDTQAGDIDALKAEVEAIQNRIRALAPEVAEQQ